MKVQTMKRQELCWILVLAMLISIGSNMSIKVKASGMADSVVSIAFSQIGYCEKANGNNLDDYTSNKGSANYTKYHRDLGATQGQPWCAFFVWWVLQTAGVPGSEYPASGSVPVWQQYFEIRGKYHARGTYHPKPGDLVIIKTSEGPRGHIGIIESADGYAFNYISGNKSDSVYKEWVKESDSQVTGYCEMNYGNTSGVVTTVNPGEPYPIPTRNIQKGSSGDDVKWIQKFANDIMGAGISVDGIAGNQTVNAIQVFQSQNGLSVDGIAGTNTINKMLEVWVRNTQDTTPPTISNVRVTTITSDSYTVEADITDNKGVVKVQFPTWPAYKSSDGCTWYEPTNVNGNHYTFKFSISDLKNYSGKYNTHIYAWDNQGNHSSEAVNYIGPLKMNPYSTTIYNGKKFEVYNSALRWMDAKEFAEAKGGKLLTLSNVADIARFTKVLNGNMLNLNTKTAYWIEHFRGKSDSTQNDNHIALCKGNEIKTDYYSVDYYAISKGDIGFIVEYDYSCSHKWSLSEEKSATCTTDGYKRYICKICNSTKDETIVATGHSWDSGKVTKAATSAEEGIKTYTCTKCKLTKTEKIKPTGETKKQGTTVYNGVDYSRVYDFNYYINTHDDVRRVFGYDDKAVIKHFVTYGMKEGRQAKADFDVKSYKNANQDLRLAYGNNLPQYYIHYMKWGYKENRKTKGVKKVLNPVTKYNGIDYSKIYDYNFYINKYADIKKAFGDDDIATIKHFATYGVREGRQAKASFDVQSYKNANKDLRLAFGNNNVKYYDHYLRWGYKEGRKTSGVSVVQNPVTSMNGVDYSRVYDYCYYVNHHPDIKKAFGNDDIATLRHFITYGMKEGRQAKEDFNMQAYRSRYEDLIRAYGSNNQAYYMHYIKWGYKEGRVGTVKDPKPKPVYLTSLKRYEKGSWAKKVDKTVEDTFGNTYVHSFTIQSCGSIYKGDVKNDFGRITYLLNGKYNHIEMTMAFDVDDDFWQYTRKSGYVRIIADDEVIYISPTIICDTKPQKISLNLDKDVNMLTISVQSESGRTDGAPIIIGSPIVSYVDK